MYAASGPPPPGQLLSSPSALNPTIHAHILPLLHAGEPGPKETEAISPIWQGYDSSSPQAPQIEPYLSFQLLYGEAQSAVRGHVTAEGLHQTLSCPPTFCQALTLGLSCFLVTVSRPGHPRPSTEARLPARLGPVPIEGLSAIWTPFLP